MRLHFLSIALLSFLTLTAHAEPTKFSIEEGMNRPEVRKVLKPGLRVLWGGRKVEDEVVERAKPDTYTRSHFGTSMFASGKKQDCMDAFADAMVDMIVAASLRDYDVITDLQGVYQGTPSDDTNMFLCDIGFKTTDVVLSGTFVQTRTGATNLEKMRNDPEQQAAIRNRQLPADTLLLPLGPILESPEAQKILKGVAVHWGNSGAPGFSERVGPNVYEEDASISRYGKEGACKQAVINALENMVDDVKEHKYNGLVAIRSYYQYQWAPDDKQVECNVAGRSALVQLVGTLVKLK
ncbi:MAG: hypothetical protein JWL63_3272 [Rhodocyclales bacterium]|nr:hypothetical protein [Rhodocyclales bacterium]